MRVVDHRLADTPVSQLDTPNQGGAIVPEYLVIHFTAAPSAANAIAHLQDPSAKASAHLVIGRDGQITQLVRFDRKAWHAGVSAWAGRQGVNDFSIGIELDNAGKLLKVGEAYQAWFGGIYPPSEVVQARQKFESQDAYWHTYARAQIDVLTTVAKVLVSQYGLKDIIGHEDIAPNRKVDPGPAFPMRSFRSWILGRGDDQPPRYRVNVEALNIRAGAGTAFDKVGEPLPLGTEVLVLQMTDLWAQVSVTTGSRAEGWVRNAYIVPIDTKP